MSDICEDDVKLLSRLCRIELNEEEFADVFLSLKKILDYVDQLQEVDVASLSPYAHVDEQGINALREDEVQELLPREVFLNNSPDQVGGMIRVPPVMKQP